MVEDELLVGIKKKNINAETRKMVELFVVKDEFLVTIFKDCYRDQKNGGGSFFGRGRRW